MEVASASRSDPWSTRPSSNGSPVVWNMTPRAETRKVTVYPEERILVGVGSKQRLIAMGRLSDGSQVDLTQQVRYTSNDDSIAAVDEAGEITAKRRGETSIMIRTVGQAAVAKVAVIQQVAERDYPAITGGTLSMCPFTQN